LKSRGLSKQQIRTYMICHVESSFWLISECVKFNTWYLRELRHCVTRGVYRMRGWLVAVHMDGVGIEKMEKLDQIFK